MKSAGAALAKAQRAGQAICCDMHEMMLQEVGTAELPLLDADFISQPRSEVTKKLTLLHPEAHGQLIKYAKVSWNSARQHAYSAAQCCVRADTRCKADSLRHPAAPTIQMGHCLEGVSTCIVHDMEGCRCGGQGHQAGAACRLAWMGGTEQARQASQP